MSNIRNKISRIETLRLRLKNLLESRHVEVFETDTLTDLINKIPTLNNIVLENLTLTTIDSNEKYLDFFDIVDKSKVKSISNFSITKNIQDWAVPLLEGLRFSSDISLAKLFDTSTYSSSNTSLPLDLSNLTTGYITSLFTAFYNVKEIPKISFGSIKFKPEEGIVNGFRNLCYGCQQLKEIHMEDMIIEPAAYDLGYMFYNCINLKTLDLSSLNFTTTGALLNGFVYNCNNLESLDISNLDITGDIATNAFYNVPSTCEILVKSDDIVNKIQSKFPQLVNISAGDLVDFSIEETMEFNISKTRTKKIQIRYSGGKKDQKRIRIQSDKATWNDATRELTLNSDVQDGDILDIIFISEYNPELQHTMRVTVVNIVVPIEVDTQDGEFIETDPTDMYTTYMSDKGSYHISNGKSNAYIRFSGMHKIVFYIKSSAESSYDYIEVFNLDINGVRGSGRITTRSKQEQWIKCEYVIPDLDEHFIHIMYSKDGSADSGADRGYFYVAEEECE